MYYDDHAPPHFHAFFGEDEALISIETLEIQEGRLPRRALVLVLEWASEHRDELREDWGRAEAHRALNKIAPLV